MDLIKTSLSYLGYSKKEETPRVEEDSRGFDPFKTYGQKQVLLSWLTPPRIARSSDNKKFVRSFTIIAAVVSIIFIAMQEYWLMILIASIIFISHVMSKAPSEKIHIELSNYGVMFDGHQYYWPQFRHAFYFMDEDYEVLALDTFKSLPGRLYLTLGDTDKEKLDAILKDRVLMLEKAPVDPINDTFKNILGKLNFKK